MEKQAKLKNHLTFLIKCRDNNIIPKGLRIKLPCQFPGSTGQSIRFSHIILRKLIRAKRCESEHNKEEVKTFTKHLQTKLTPDQSEKLHSWCKEAAETVNRSTKESQRKKLENLIEQRRKRTRNLDRKKLVRNLSNRVLTDNEEQVLMLGLNFAITPKQIPTADIISSMEATARQLDAPTANSLRVGISNVLNKARPPTPNLNHKMKKAIKDLRADKQIIILPADKGNITVVLNRDDYNEKIDALLQDHSTYKKIPKDPTTKIEARITRAIKDVKQKISDKLRLAMTPQHSIAPQLYGLPKVHKDQTPLRPIVSTIGSPTYQLAKELARIIRPLCGQTESYVRNSAHFVDILKNISMDDLMVSFDVVSLFTKVPIEEALEIIHTRLQED